MDAFCQGYSNYSNNNVRVRKITIDGTVTTLIGDGTYGNLDGPVADAKIVDGYKAWRTTKT